MVELVGTSWNGYCCSCTNILNQVNQCHRARPCPVTNDLFCLEMHYLNIWARYSHCTPYSQISNGKVSLLLKFYYTRIASKTNCGENLFLRGFFSSISGTLSFIQDASQIRDQHLVKKTLT